MYIGASTVLPCTDDNRVIKDGYVKIENDKIIEVGELSRFTDEQKKEISYFENATLMPGLINAHEHLVTKSKYTPWQLDTIK